MRCRLPGLGTVLTLAALLAIPTVITAQAPAALTVTGAVEQPLRLTSDDLARMGRVEVTTTNGGIETRYEGVWMHEILRAAGLPLGNALRGAALTTYILATADDGYQVVFSLGELDPGFKDNQILVADMADGRPLYGDDGSFRIVAPLEARGARSVRQLTSLEVVRLRP